MPFNADIIGSDFRKRPAAMTNEIEQLENAASGDEVSRLNNSEQEHPAATPHIFPSPSEYIRSHGRLRSEDHWEVIRSLVFPMVMQRIPAAEIGAVFDVSADTIGRWKKRIFDDMRREAVTMQPRDFIMESLESLREARAEAWKGYTLATTVRDRRSFLQTITQIESQFGKMGADIGLFGGRGDKPMSPTTYGDATDDLHAQQASRIHRMLEALLITENAENESNDANFGGTFESVVESYDTLLSIVRGVNPEDESSPSISPTATSFKVRTRRRQPD
jgi:hypothetical protein